MSLADGSNMLRYGDFPDSKYPPSNNIHGQKDVERKVAPGTQVENLERHETSTVPARGWEDLNSQRIGMGLKHRRDLRSEGRWFKDALFRRDEILAPRMEALGIEEEDFPVIDLGNAAAYHRNDDFIHQARNTLTGNYRQAVLGASDWLRSQYEKERKKDMQSKRRREQAIKAEMLKLEEAQEEVKNALDEEQREVEKAQKKIKLAQAAMDQGNGPDEIHELTPLSPNLEGGTTLSRIITKAGRISEGRFSSGPLPTVLPATTHAYAGLPVSIGTGPYGPYWPDGAFAPYRSAAIPSPLPTLYVNLHDDEGDRKAADPATDHNDIFITSTISEDRTGNQEGITRERLAALGARCAFRMSKPQAEEHFQSRDDRGPEYSIFVGDLGPEVNEFVLVSLFQSRFPSCKSAKIMTDPISGMSRGYGFVRFLDEVDQQRALSEMQGVYCGNRPMRLSTATPKNKGGPGGPGGMGMPGGVGPMYPPAMGGPPLPFYGQQQQQQPMNQFTDPNNTTVFVGGLSAYVTEDELRSFFQGFGEITYVKIPPGKGCGFVQFVQRHAAEMVINQMQGYPIGNSRVRLSWGRSQNNSSPASTPYRPAPPPPIYPSMGMPPSH